VPDGLVILDKLHRVDWANPAAATLMNVHWPEDDGRPLFEILTHPDLRDFVEAGESLRPMDLAPEHNRALMLSLRITPSASASASGWWSRATSPRSITST
jgi:two-component system, OmpR family, phosphate regulon sensor histidine kinase PhoR